MAVLIHYGFMYFRISSIVLWLAKYESHISHKWESRSVDHERQQGGIPTVLLKDVTTTAKMRKMLNVLLCILKHIKRLNAIQHKSN